MNMGKATSTDAELLKEWLVQNCESAFHSLVSRYAGLVYATAKRSCGDDTLAAEASQLTFIALAQKAKSLTSYSTLGGWLHLTAALQAKNLVRKSQREIRKRLLLQSDMETESHRPPTNLWQEMQPVLEDALASLSDKDRETLILRFYRSLTIREIATTLGISTDAAHKRTERATDRLRSKLAHRGFQTSGSLSAALLAGYTAEAQAIPLSVSLVASKAIAAAAISSSSLTHSLLTFSLIMKSSSFIIPAIITVALTSWITYQHHSLSLIDRANTTAQQALVNATVRPLSASFSKKSNSPTVVQTTWKPGSNIDSTGGKNLIIQMAATLEDRNEESGPIWEYFKERTRSLSKEEIRKALEEIDAHSFHHTTNSMIVDQLFFALKTIDPEECINLYGDRLMKNHATEDSFMKSTFREWASQEWQRADEWLDRQNKSGKYESHRLDNKDSISDMLNSQMIDALLQKDPDKAKLRLESLPKEKRGNIFFKILSIYDSKIKFGDPFKFEEFTKRYGTTNNENKMILKDCYETITQQKMD